MSLQQRDYQTAGRDAVFETWEQGVASTLVVMPTGTGKTVLSGMCIEEFHRRQGRPTLFVAHREHLITQAYSSFSEMGLECAIEMGDSRGLDYIQQFGMPECVVGSIQSLQNDRLLAWPRDSFGLIIVDECHHAASDQYLKIINHFQAVLLGITATPKRGDRKNLGGVFSTLAYELRLRKAIEDHWLKPIKIHQIPTTVDLRGIKMVGGDFSLGELEERIAPQLEILARSFLQHCGARPAVCFLPDVASAHAFSEVLNALNEWELTGVQSRYVAGTQGKFGMPKDEKNANLAAFDRGDYQVIVCCEVLTEGWDCRRVECVGILRPTRQQYRYTQMVGRGTRLIPGRPDAGLLVLDFDWLTDSEVKDLCCIFDLFDDGSIDKNVYAVAKQIAEMRDDEIDPMEVIKEAERVIRTRDRFRVMLTGKEEKIAAMEMDPLGVAKMFDMKLNRNVDIDWRHNNPATEAQLATLTKFGVANVGSLSKFGASKLIGKLMKRKEKHLSSHKQIQALIVAGVEADVARGLSFEDAKDAIIELDTAAKLIQRRMF